MTDSRLDNLHSVGGSQHSMTQEELRANSLELQTKPKSLKEDADGASRSMDWNFNSSNDVATSTKYPSNTTATYLANGALVIEPVGTITVSSSSNEASRPLLAADSDGLKSSASTTTLGSKIIDTLDGFEMNPLTSTFPSSFFSPQKVWTKSLFPSISSKKLIEIAFMEAITVLLFTALKKRTKSEQIVQETHNEVDIATIIIDNQEIENNILAEVHQH